MADNASPIEVPPVDPGNPMVRHDYPSLITTGYVNSPEGMRIALTLRVANGTMTVILTREQMIELAGKFHTDAMNMPGGGLIVPGMQVMPTTTATQNGASN